MGRVVNKRFLIQVHDYYVGNTLMDLISRNALNTFFSKTSVLYTMYHNQFVVLLYSPVLLSVDVVFIMYYCYVLCCYVIQTIYAIHLHTMCSYTAITVSIMPCIYCNLVIIYIKWLLHKMATQLHCTVT